MKIIITENQNYVLRRLQQFIEIVEDQIEGYELNEDGSWWCNHNNPDTFFISWLFDIAKLGRKIKLLLCHCRAA